MRLEIRIYFECLEQAMHYFLPFVKKGINETSKNIEVKLIRKIRSVSNITSCIDGIYSLTTPDILITICDNKREIPILLIELSEAVITEDHELQRAIGPIVAYLSDSIYLKISGKKISPKEHGGKKDFNPFTVGKILFDRFKYKGFILGDWPTQIKNPYILQRDESFLSCPPKGSIPIIEDAIKIAIRESIRHFDSIAAKENNIVDIVHDIMLKEGSYNKYFQQLQLSPSIKQLKEDWQKRRNNSNYLLKRIYLDQEKIIIKINRFSHAADPDRGILVFSSFVFDDKLIYARYKVKKDSKNISELISTFASEASSRGITFFNQLKSLPIKNDLHDITNFLIKTKRSWQSNKVLKSLFLFSDGIIIHDKNNSIRLSLKWNRNNILGISDEKKWIRGILEFYHLDVYSDPLPLSISTELNEDEVSYIVIHNILVPNGYKVLSVSYPGAQGDAAILPDSDKGRKQKRLYIDIIAIPPSFKNNIALEESKDYFNSKSINEAVQRLNLFKTDKNMFSALVNTLKRFHYQYKIKRILIGVAFGVKNKISYWQPYNIDYLIRIYDKSKWQVAYFGNLMRKTFKFIEGTISLPTIFEIKKS